MTREGCDLKIPTDKNGRENHPMKPNVGMQEKWKNKVSNIKLPKVHNSPLTQRCWGQTPDEEFRRMIIKISNAFQENTNTTEYIKNPIRYEWEIK